MGFAAAVMPAGCFQREGEAKVSCAVSNYVTGELLFVEVASYFSSSPPFYLYLCFLSTANSGGTEVEGVTKLLK